MRLKLWLLIICLCGLFLTSSQAEIIKKGQVGFRFLENPVGADAIGRGGLGVAATSNSNAVFWNPAGIAWIEGRYDINANLTKGIADINHASLVAAMAINDICVVAVDALVMDYGEFYGTRRSSADAGYDETGTFTPQSYAIGLSFSQRVSDRFSYGVHLKYAHQDLGSAWIGTAGTDVDDPALIMDTKHYAHSEPAIDIGAVYDFLSHGIRFGAVIQNFSREIKYEQEKFPLPFAVSFSLMADPFSFFPSIDKKHAMMVGFESRHPRDFKEKIKFGAEYTYFERYILRLGYMTQYDERGLCFGLGVCLPETKNRYRFDYAFENFGILGAVHILTFGVGLN